MTDFIADFKAVLETSWATLPQEGTTTHAQAKQDLEALLKDMTAIDIALKARPLNLTGAEIEKIKPEIIAYCRTHLKTAYTLKNLSSPFSLLNGISEVLTTLQTIHAQFLGLMGQCALRLPQTEIDLPGYGKFFVYVLQTVTKPYHQHLAKAVPPTIQSVIQEIESAADAAVLNAVAGCKGRPADAPPNDSLIKTLI